VNAPQPQETVQRRRRGCLLSGCIILVVLFLLSLVGLLLGYRIFLHTFTSRTPAHFPPAQLSVPERDAVHAKITRFRDAVRAAQPSPPLTLNAEEINAALVTEPELQPYTNMLHIAKIDEHGIEADVSVPIDKVPLRLPMTHGRYINGKATFSLSLTNGTLKIKAQELSVDGKGFPARFMDKIRTWNLAADINNDARSSPGLNRLQSVQVQDGNLVIVAPPAE
jgi:hypothetical protein